MSGCPNPDCERPDFNHPRCRVFDEAAEDFTDLTNPFYRPPRNVSAATAKASITAAVALTAPDVRVSDSEAPSEPLSGPWSAAERETVLQAVRRVCERHAGGGEFTSDAIWAELGAGVRVTHGLTSVLQQVRREGWMESTGKKARSTRPREDHDDGRELVVWYSLREKIANRNH